MPIVRWLIIGVIVLAGALYGYLSRSEPVDLQAIAAFSQRLTVQYQEGIEISTRMAELEVLIDERRDGVIDDGAFKAALEPGKATIGRSIRDFRGRVSPDLVAPPAGNAARDSSMQAFVDQVAALPGMLEEQFATVEALEQAALAGDDAAYGQAKARSLEHSAEMIAAENVTIDAGLRSLKESHPQHGYLTAVMGSNEAMAVALRVLAADYRDQGFDAAGYARDVEAALARAESGVTGGEAAAKEMARNFEAMTGGSDLDQRGRAMIVRLMAMYDTAFAIERRMVAVERRFLDALRTVSAGGEAEPALALTEEIAALQLQIDGLVAERMGEFHARLQLVQELGRMQNAG